MRCSGPAGAVPPGGALSGQVGRVRRRRRAAVVDGVAVSARRPAQRQGRRIDRRQLLPEPVERGHQGQPAQWVTAHSSFFFSFLFSESPSYGSLNGSKA